MAKDQIRDDDEVNVDDIAEGTDEDVQAVSGGGGALQNIFKSRLARILGYSVVAILLIGISVALAVFISRNMTTRQLKEQDARGLGRKESPLSTFGLNEFKLSTADKDESHFVRLAISLGYKQGDMKIASELSARRDQIRDIINAIIMRSKKTDIDEWNEQIQLKELIKETINQKLQDGEIQEVFFTEISIM